MRYIGNTSDLTGDDYFYPDEWGGLSTNTFAISDVIPINISGKSANLLKTFEDFHCTRSINTHRFDAMRALIDFLEKYESCDDGGQDFFSNLINELCVSLTKEIGSIPQMILV